MDAALDGFDFGFLAKMFMNKLQGQKSEPKPKNAKPVVRRKALAAISQGSTSFPKNRVAGLAPRAEPRPQPYPNHQLAVFSQFEALRMQFLRQLVVYQKQILALQMPILPPQQPSALPPNFPRQSPGCNISRNPRAANLPARFTNYTAVSKHSGQTTGHSCDRWLPPSEVRGAPQKKRKVHKKFRKTKKLQVQRQDSDLSEVNESRPKRVLRVGREDCTSGKAIRTAVDEETRPTKQQTHNNRKPWGELDTVFDSIKEWSSSSRSEEKQNAEEHGKRKVRTLRKRGKVETKINKNINSNEFVERNTKYLPQQPTNICQDTSC